MVDDNLCHRTCTEPLDPGGIGGVTWAVSGHLLGCAAPLLALLSLTSCSGRDTAPPPLTAEVPLHLEQHLDAATITGSEIPTDVPTPLTWTFDQPQPDWRSPAMVAEGVRPVEPAYVDDAVRLSLTAANRHGATGQLVGAIYVDLPDFRIEEWAYVEIRARTADPVRLIGLAFNHDPDQRDMRFLPFYSAGDRTFPVSDGTVQTYRLRLYWEGMREWEGAWRDLGLWFNASGNVEAASLDILSIELVPVAATYGDEPAGARAVLLGGTYRQAIFSHTPARLAYRLIVPEGGRLDLGLAALRGQEPVTFIVSAQADGQQAEVLLDAAYDGGGDWDQRAVDLSHLQGEAVTLTLEADADRAGAVALWGAPTVSGARSTDRPNVIFYVIDGAGADYLSAYGYNRRTTPTLERLAAEGALFEHAYSNADWTRPSTASFMTSLHHSVLGGFQRGFNVIPEDAPTMAQHMHRAGYQTAVFTANPNAGSMSGLERGVDRFQENWAAFSYGEEGDFKESSRYLHEAFWKWREQRPAEPYWVHFQTVDVHQEVPANPPFAGLFVAPEEVRTWSDWNERLREEGSHAVYSPAYERTGISRVEFFTLHQGLHDENMAHNDYQLGRLVDRLKAEGEWENTLLVIGSDHSVTAAMDDMGIATLETLPPRWSNPSFRPSYTRIPLLFVWPGHIAGGQRIEETVSMIDVLPTILDLTGQPMPEVMQGQSLAPLLLGQEGWEPRPVIIEQLNADGLVPEEYSRIEVVDGRWGASLEISPAPEPPGPVRPVPLLLYDLWSDPMCLHSLHEERPDLVAKYTAVLEERFAIHQALGQQFSQGAEVMLTPEQLRALRALGYIR